MMVGYIPTVHHKMNSLLCQCSDCSASGENIYENVSVVELCAVFSFPSSNHPMAFNVSISTHDGSAGMPVLLHAHAMNMLGHFLTSY